MPTNRLALHGRDREIRMIGEFFGLISNGNGHALVFEGGSGMGKSAILRFLRDEASEQGIQVLHARAAEFERNFAWGVARQLFERWMTSASQEEKRVVLSGAAGLAAPLLAYDQGALPSMSDRHPMVHGLYWLCRNLSEKKPLVIVIDDAHWADVESLNMLAYLANRLEDGPIGLAMATIPLEEVSQGELLAAATICPFAQLVRLQPLGIDAMKAMAVAEFGGEPEDSFVKACGGASRGNPLFVRELLEHAAFAGIDPLGSEVPKLRKMAPRRMAVHVLRHLNRLGNHARRIASAVAVLGVDADPRNCAAVAQLSNSESTTAARALVDAGILRVGLPFGFAHPNMQYVVYSTLTARDRHDAHHLAARTLSAAGEPVAAVARHLVGTLPGADSWVIQNLREAAAECRKNGDSRKAVELLRRALAEPPDDPTSSKVLAELGSAELRARDEAAIGHLTEALRRTDRYADRHGTNLDLGHALMAGGRHQDAVDVLAEGLQDACGENLDAVRQLRSTLLLITEMTTAEAPPGVDQGAGIELAHLALRGLCSDLPADRVARLATGALRSRQLVGNCDLELPPASLAAWALAHSGRLTEATKALSSIMDEAREAGQLLVADTTAGMQSVLLYEAGQLNDAESAALPILLESENALAGPGAWLAAAAFLQTSIELDRAHAARSMMDRLGMDVSVPTAAFCVPFGLARGRLAIATGDLEDGIRRLTAIRAMSLKYGWHYPGAMADSLIPLSNALAQVDDTDLAFAIIQDELARARAFGAPKPLAVALRTYGLFIGGKPSLNALEEAVHLLEDSPFLLDRAHGLVDWGSALRRAGQRTEGRQLLLQGLELAQQCGAVPLSGLARSELRLAGGRMRTAQQPVTAQLTPAEHRVVVKAANGLTNKQIALALFVTVKTVEWHLGQAYRKLGINKRAELAAALPNVNLQEDTEPAVS